MTAYFCGVWPGHTAGHYCYLPTGHKAGRGSPLSPWAGDAWSPLTDSRCYPHMGCKLVAGMWDTPRDAREGVRYHDQRDGWTLVAWWDRSGDHRGGSIAAFAFDEVLTPDAAEARARELFPAVWQRIDIHLGRTTEAAVLRQQVLTALATAPQSQVERVAAVLGIGGPR